MPFMTWSRHFVTGIAEVDAQHRALVDLVNEVAPALTLAGDARPEAIAPLLDRLFAYAATHFQQEEGLMRARGIDPAHLELHRARHAAFVDDVTLMRARLERDGTCDAPQLLRFLAGWLTFHILGEDQAMARQLALIAGGATPSEARRAAESEHGDDSAHAVLNAALLDLFMLNHERNRELVATNAALHAARDQLQALNADLEREVRARTAEVASAVAALEADRRRLEQANRELRETQSALIQAEKLRAVGQLAAGIAHEINTPVQFVGDSVAFLSEGFDVVREVVRAYERHIGGSPEALAEALAELEERLDAKYVMDHIPDALTRSQEGLRRVAELVMAIKEFAHPDGSGKVAANVERALVNCLTIVRRQLADVALVETRFAGLPPVPCRVGELKQVFLNLLVNAADAIRDVVGKAGGGMGKIEIVTRVDDDHAVIAFTDTGGGIPDAVVPRIFEPFFTTKDVGRGTGQGLPISRSIVVDKHGGSLDFTTEVGRGTTFYVRLPLTMAPAG